MAYDLRFNMGAPVTDSTDSTFKFSDSMANWGTDSNTTNSFLPSIDQMEWAKQNNVDFSGNPIAPRTFSEMTGLQKITAGLGLAQGLANAWLGYQQNRLARDNFNFQKGIMNTNLANQIASYNTALEDRIRGRYSAREQEANPNLVNDYLEQNRAVNRMA